ncbi:MAG: SH3 domain-containing protein [Dysosmobacter sp.]
MGVTADSVRLRAAANTGSAILAELNRGTAVSVLGRQDGWYKVNYDGKTGYMSADYVTARSSAGDLRCVARVISDGLNLRSGAAASGAVPATAPGRICGRPALKTAGSGCSTAAKPAICPGIT